jgi:hypothetical protein
MVFLLIYIQYVALSVYVQDTDCAAAALVATQKLLQTNCVDFSHKEFPTTGMCRNAADPFIHVSSKWSISF